MEFSDITEFFLKLEGPYKWYVLGVILVGLTAIMTRVIFKTFKWFLIIVALAVIGFTLVNYFVPIDLDLVGEGSEQVVE